jgi:hypothetical protein
MTSGNRSAKIVLPATNPATSSRPEPRMRATPYTTDDKQRARARYGEAHRDVSAKVTVAAAAEDNKTRRSAVYELNESLVSRVCVSLLGLSFVDDEFDYRASLTKPFGRCPSFPVARGSSIRSSTIL